MTTIRSKLGPIPADNFDGEVKFNPDVERAYSPASNERMKALRRRHLPMKERAFIGAALANPPARAATGLPNVKMRRS
jgi:hypothetical protein